MWNPELREQYNRFFSHFRSVVGYDIHKIKKIYDEIDSGKFKDELFNEFKGGFPKITQERNRIQSSLLQKTYEKIKEKQL